jgi:hypothetical protein
MAMNIDTLIAFGRKAFDDGAKAEISRAALIDSLIAAGFTYANTAAYTDKDVKAGKVSNENIAHRGQLGLIAVASIKIKGKRLSDDDLAKFADDGVSNKVLLAGTAKGNISGETTWKGNATSWLSKVRNDLEARENAAKDKAAGTPNAPKSKKEVFLDYLQKAYNLTFKEDNPCEDAEAAQKDLLALAKSTVNGTLSAPKRA